MRRLIFACLSLAWGYLTLRLTTTPQLVVSGNALVETLVMMGGHFSFFGILAGLVSAVLPGFWLPLGVASLYGLWIEYLQLSVPGRTADPVDWLLDTVGAAAALIFLRYLKRRGIIKL